MKYLLVARSLKSEINYVLGKRTTYPNKHRRSANKWVFVVASVWIDVVIWAWHDGHVTCAGLGPNASGTVVCTTTTI